MDVLSTFHPREEVEEEYFTISEFVDVVSKFLVCFMAVDSATKDATGVSDHPEAMQHIVSLILDTDDSGYVYKSTVRSW